jgi:hypothetical protein
MPEDLQRSSSDYGIFSALLARCATRDFGLKARNVKAWAGAKRRPKKDKENKSTGL